MKYMVVTINVSNCTIMMARTLHIIHHCIFTNMDHIYTYLYKETEAYWHICKCIKISTMHHKYEYEKNKHIVGIRDDKDTVNWACIMRTCASTIHTHTRARTFTCTYVHVPSVVVPNASVVTTYITSWNRTVCIVRSHGDWFIKWHKLL